MKLIQSVITHSLTVGLLWAGGVVASRGAEKAMSAKDIQALRATAQASIAPLPDKMPGAEKDTPALVRLGEKLYFDKRLSVNNTISCNSCHAVDQRRGGVDNQPTSPGAFGKRGGRNSPTVLNAGFQLAQFWDGRAPSLQHQAKGPVLNPIEMAMPDDAAVLKRIKTDGDYDKLFHIAFHGQANPITYDNVAEAIAAYERTLVTRDRFDDFLKGDDHALTPQELAGLRNFLNTGCTTCHSGPVIGGNSYQKVGLVNPYPTADKGRVEVTKDADDQFKFKVPMLRNIAITGPYFHDGAVSALDEAVDKMAWHQLGKRLSPEERKSIVTFLQTLTGKDRAVQKNAAVGSPRGTTKVAGLK